MKDKTVNLRQFRGNSYLASHVYFRRGTEMYCVYCGEKATTREHCPSKAFLKKPFPTDLPTVPACKKCNNGFSSDESYTKKMLDFLYMYYIQDVNIYNQISSDDDRETREAREAAKRFIEKPYYDERITRVFRKLAICHAAYEISKGFYCDEWKGELQSASYMIRSLVDDNTWQDLEYMEVLNGDLCPEEGSRVYGNIYVVQLDLQAVDNGKKEEVNLYMLDWTDIQDGYYKYQAFLRDNKIYVKMIFNDFLYAEIVFKH